MPLKGSDANLHWNHFPTLRIVSVRLWPTSQLNMRPRATGGGPSHLQRAPKTCAKIPKISQILDPVDPRSCKILDLVCSFSHGILEILDPVAAKLPGILGILDLRQTIFCRILGILDPNWASCREILQILDPTQQESHCVLTVFYI